MTLKALIVGINQYANPLDNLSGCVNDARAMTELLQTRYGLIGENTRVVLNGEATVAGVMDGLHWLAEQSRAADTSAVLFHYSGHGIRVADQNGDEPDGSDEALALHDYATVGATKDDDLRVVYDQFNPQVPLVFLMDCCHSGTIARPIGAFREILPTAAQRQAIEAARLLFIQQREEALQDPLLELLTRVQNGTLSAPDAVAAMKDLQASFDQRRMALDKMAGTGILYAACHASQLAEEVDFSGTRQGVFTWALLQVLQDATPGTLSYRAVAELAFAKITQQLQKAQRPELQADLVWQDKPFLG